jgi:hypothetical protein
MSCKQRWFNLFVDRYAYWSKEGLSFLLICFLVVSEAILQQYCSIFGVVSGSLGNKTKWTKTCIIDLRESSELNLIWEMNCVRLKWVGDVWEQKLTLAIHFRGFHNMLRGRCSSPDRIENFLFPMLSRLALGPTQPPVQWVLGVEQLGCAVDPSPPTSVKVKKTRVYNLC